MEDQQFCMATTQSQVAPGNLVDCPECAGRGWRCYGNHDPFVCQNCKGKKYVPIKEWPAVDKAGA